jgi:ABC-2 type transport system permease protein
MLLQHMGRENALKGMREFIRHYRLNRDHPVLQDFIATMRPFAPDPAAYDAFVKQWFLEVAVPEYKLSDARREEAGDHWQVTVHVENAGTGIMPLEIAAAAGERFGDDGQASSDYHDAREKVTLAAGESKDVTIRCSFKPDRVLVDPDAVVLQLLRKLAVVRF